MSRGRNAKSVDGKRDFGAKVEMTQVLRKEVDEFVTTYKGLTFHSRNDFFQLAARFFMAKYKEARGRFDERGFPEPPIRDGTSKGIPTKKRA